jgi:hypothetical protein
LELEEFFRDVGLAVALFGADRGHLLGRDRTGGVAPLDRKSVV